MDGVVKRILAGTREVVDAAFDERLSVEQPPAHSEPEGPAGDPDEPSNPTDEPPPAKKSRAERWGF